MHIKIARMADEIRDKLSENAQGPRAIETDGLRVQEHSPADLIAADKYLAKTANVGKSTLPVRIGRFRPGSAAR